MFLRASLILLAIMTASCSLQSDSNIEPLNNSSQYYNYIQPTFTQYQQVTHNWLVKNRRFISSDPQKELRMNMPQEFKHENTDKAVLLVHGLGDSPYSFSDLAQTLYKQGFTVQTLLLPGHGSKPSDLMIPHYQDWQNIVDHYANLLKKDYANVWLGGFSTGGNLVTIHALESQDIAGLLLFSPGFQSQTPVLEKFAPFASLFTDGFNAEEKNLARYTSAPLNGAIAYSESASKLRQLLKDKTFTGPTLIAISESDSVVDPFAVKKMYLERFPNSANQLIWYGESTFESQAIKTLSMRLAEQKISTASHMSPLYSPNNTYYGAQGEYRLCMNSLSDEQVLLCEQGAEVWFSAWGYKEKGKIHARLTWNPYYKELTKDIIAITNTSIAIDNKNLPAAHTNALSNAQK